VAGLIVGIVQSMMATLWPQGASLAIYVAMVAIVLVMPRGLLGRA
jgi:branched-chain amino acid transport system permease protein